MIVADTSAWIEFLRATGSREDVELRRLLNTEAEIGITDIVAMELLAGARPKDIPRLRTQMLQLPILPLDGLGDFEEAAALYRACRSSGETIRSLTDCLIAVPVIHAEAELLHKDSDFEALARHSDLQIYRH